MENYALANKNVCTNTKPEFPKSNVISKSIKGIVWAFALIQGKTSTDLRLIIAFPDWSGCVSSL